MKYVKSTSLAASFGHALRGIPTALRTERNLRIDLAASAVIVALGLAIRLSTIEWCIVITLCGLVIAAELFNTAIEKSLDVITKEYNATVKSVKDIAAGAVLVIAVTAAIVGVIIFISKIVQ